MRIKLFFFILLFTPIILLPQKENDVKLVIRILIDQLRYDYLERYYIEFGDIGFKWLISEGTNSTNSRINYIPTVTGASHTSINTGATPYYYGIIANYLPSERHYASTHGSGHSSGNHIRMIVFCKGIKPEK